MLYPHYHAFWRGAGLFFRWWKLQKAFRTARLDANWSEVNYDLTLLDVFSTLLKCSRIHFRSFFNKNKTGLICQLCFWRILGSRMFPDFSHYNWAIYILKTNTKILAQLITTEPLQHCHYLNVTLPNRVIYLSFASARRCETSPFRVVFQQCKLEHRHSEFRTGSFIYPTRCSSVWNIPLPCRISAVQTRTPACRVIFSHICTVHYDKCKGKHWPKVFRMMIKRNCRYIPILLKVLFRHNCI